MKVNIWQVLGLLLIIVGVVFVARDKLGTSDTVNQPASPAANPPATTQAAP